MMSRNSKASTPLSPIALETMISHPTRKEKKEYENDMKQYGFFIGNIHSEQKRTYLPYMIFRALLIFMCAYGSLGAAVSAFRLSFNQWLVIPVLAFVSLYTSLLYYNRLILYIGYSLLMIGYMFYLMYYYLYINSGFQAFMNMLYNDYSDYFKLLSVRQAYEVYTDRYQSVSHAMIFIGILLIILLNVTISGYMNIYETMIISLVAPITGLYIHNLPSITYLIILFSAYICIIILGTGGYGILPIKTRHSREFVHVSRKNNRLFLYRSNFNTALYILGLSFLLGFLLCLVVPSFLSKDYENYRQNQLKQKTDDQVKMLVQNGFSSLFNRYAAVGGMSRGKLGGVSSVRPDFETDLKVTFSPYSYDTVYLKSYQGSSYSSSFWQTSVFDRMFASEMDHLYQDSSKSSAKMSIVNIAADSTLNYRPYQSFTATDENGYQTLSFPRGNTDTFDYIPYLPSSPKDDILTPDALEKLDALSSSEFFSELTSVPDSYINDYIYLCTSEDFMNTNDTDYDSGLSSVNSYRLAVARNIKQYFLRDFTYTMSPGNTPRGRDFVYYFLFTQKRGYCAHFASAAVMLLRTMGIPARYAEGYCIPYSLMEEGSLVSNENPEEWFTGKKKIDEDLVLSVDINDSYAHAWVEIWMEGYGFVPYEFTPPSFEEEASPNKKNGLWGLLSGLVSIQGMEDISGIGTTELHDVNANQSHAFFSKSNAGLFLPVLILIAAIILLGILKKTADSFFQLLSMKKYTRQKHYDKLASAYYLAFLRRVKRLLVCYLLTHRKKESKSIRIKALFEELSGNGFLPRDLYVLNVFLPDNGNELSQLISLTSEYCFSNNDNDIDMIINYRAITKSVYHMIKHALFLSHR